MNNSKIMKDKYFTNNDSLPPCINVGCDNSISVREWKYWSFKSECSRCSTARKSDKVLEGITIHKKKYCENRDGNLGFDCPVPKDFIWNGFESTLDMDHINGDHMDNRILNVKTYCKLCHGRKTIESGDTNRWKKTARVIESMGGK